MKVVAKGQDGVLSLNLEHLRVLSAILRAYDSSERTGKEQISIDFIKRRIDVQNASHAFGRVFNKPTTS